MYRVIKSFTDAQDDMHVYLAGDTYPREGLKVSEERVAELSSKANRRGEVLIVAVDVPEKAKIQPQKAKKAKADKVPDKIEKAPKKARKKE